MSTATDATIHSAVTCPYSGCKRRRIPKSMIYVYDIIYMCMNIYIIYKV